MSEALAECAQLWQPPAVDGPVVNPRETAPRPPEAEDYAARYQSGYEAGLAAGRAQAQTLIEQLKSQVAHLEQVCQFLARPLDELDEEIERQLTLLALAVGKQILRRELKTDPAQIIALIRESVARLPAAAREVRIHLHPEDAAIVREHLSTPAERRAWSLVEDPSLTRGGCLIRAGASQIDARLESRLNALISAALGEERTAGRAAVA